MTMLPIDPQAFLNLSNITSPSKIRLGRPGHRILKIYPSNIRSTFVEEVPSVVPIYFVAHLDVLTSMT